MDSLRSFPFCNNLETTSDFFLLKHIVIENTEVQDCRVSENVFSLAWTKIFGSFATALCEEASVWRHLVLTVVKEIFSQWWWQFALFAESLKQTWNLCLWRSWTKQIACNSSTNSFETHVFEKAHTAYKEGSALTARSWKTGRYVFRFALLTTSFYYSISVSVGRIGGIAKVTLLTIYTCWILGENKEPSST